MLWSWMPETADTFHSSLSKLQMKMDQHAAIQDTERDRKSTSFFLGGTNKPLQFSTSLSRLFAAASHSTPAAEFAVMLGLLKRGTILPVPSDFCYPLLDASLDLLIGYIHWFLCLNLFIWNTDNFFSNFF
ncbi:uncharacterized protein LOC144027256 [Festucalex cinctus]